MNKLNISNISIVLTILVSGCSDGEPPAPASTSKVDNPILLKSLAIGTNINSISNAKKFGNRDYMFDYDYFGKSRNFRVTTNDKGLIYKYETTLDGSIYTLQSALEEKLTADNGKPIIFNCNTKNIEPDSSATLTYITCKVSGKTEELTIKETTMQPKVKYAGLAQLPTTVLSITLEGTALSAEVKSADDKAKIERERVETKHKRNDL